MKNHSSKLYVKLESKQVIFFKYKYLLNNINSDLTQDYILFIVLKYRNSISSSERNSTVD